MTFDNSISHMKNLIFLCLVLLSIIGCAEKNTQQPTVCPAAPTYDVISLTGKTLTPPVESKETWAKKDSLLEVAVKNHFADPQDLDNIIWLGRRTAYLWRYQEAIDIYTAGMKWHPKSPELYRHRGHRYISTRQLDKAIADFKKAALLAEGRELEVEPDGLPNHLNKPLTNLHGNIYYHLGLAYYLKGDFAKAAAVYEKAKDWDVYPDGKVSTADWLYMTYRRLNDMEKADSVLATIPTDWEMIENHSYYQRLKLYKGLLQPEDLLDFSKTDLNNQLDLVTQGYGVGNWYLYNGDTAKAHLIFDKILETDYWSAFGYIAAEAEFSSTVGSSTVRQSH